MIEKEVGSKLKQASGKLQAVCARNKKVEQGNDEGQNHTAAAAYLES